MKKASMEDRIVGVCAICGEEIYDGDDFYRMPDDMLVCGDKWCLLEWAEEYKNHFVTV